MVFLYAVRSGALDGVPLVWPKFKKEILSWLDVCHPEILREIRGKQALSPELKSALDQALKGFIQEATAA